MDRNIIQRILQVVLLLLFLVVYIPFTLMFLVAAKMPVWVNWLPLILIILVIYGLVKQQKWQYYFFAAVAFTSIFVALGGKIHFLITLGNLFIIGLSMYLIQFKLDVNKPKRKRKKKK